MVKLKSNPGLENLPDNRICEEAGPTSGKLYRVLIYLGCNFEMFEDNNM